MWVDPLSYFVIRNQNSLVETLKKFPRLEVVFSQVLQISYHEDTSQIPKKSMPGRKSEAKRTPKSSCCRKRNRHSGERPEEGEPD